MPVILNTTQLYWFRVGAYMCCAFGGQVKRTDIRDALEKPCRERCDEGRDFQRVQRGLEESAPSGRLATACWPSLGDVRMLRGMCT